MNKIPLYLAFVALALTFVGCNDEDKKELSDVAIMITPLSGDSITLKSGEKIRYTIDFHTQHDYVKQLKVSSFDAVRGKVDILDTIFNGKLSTYFFDYSTPYINRDSLIILLTFEAWDNAGSQCRTTRTVIVLNSSHIIEEKSGIVLRSSESGMPDAFSFANPSQTFNWKQSPDSVNADIYLVADSEFSNLWLLSKTKAKMVRINSFDYPSATAPALQAVYEGVVRDDRIDNLHVNDIILVGHDINAEGVMMITNIVRTGTNQERCVQLSFKGVD